MSETIDAISRLELQLEEAKLKRVPSGPNKKRCTWLIMYGSVALENLKQDFMSNNCSAEDLAYRMGKISSACRMVVYLSVPDDDARSVFKIFE